jgi:hypothetical protein
VGDTARQKKRSGIDFHATSLREVRAHTRVRQIRGLEQASAVRDATNKDSSPGRNDEDAVRDCCARISLGAKGSLGRLDEITFGRDRGTASSTHQFCVLLFESWSMVAGTDVHSHESYWHSLAVGSR